jgi:hypothetical protein
MTLDEELLHQARETGRRLGDLQERADQAKNDYHHAVRQLHLAGASLREIAEELGISHQRVHQIVDAAGGTASWKPRRTAGSGLRCSFCGASKEDVTSLVAGPGVFICGDCVTLGHQVVEEAKAATHLESAPTTSTLSCSFCARPASRVGKLVAGPGVRICDGCVAFCAEVIAAQRSGVRNP